MALTLRRANGGGSPTQPVLLTAALAAVLGAFVYLLWVLAGIAAAGRAEGSPEDALDGGGADALAQPGPRRFDGTSPGAIADALAAALSAGEFETTGVAVVSLDGAVLGGINLDLPGYAASTYKLALLYEAERRVAAGTLTYDDRVPVTDEARAEDLGTIDRLPIAADGTVSLGEALTAMVTFSDNASAVALLRLLGPAEVDAALRGIGVATMSVNDPGLPATARDLALVMAAIARGDGLTQGARDHALGLLAAQEIRSGIPAALDALPGVRRVGNKTGTWPNATRDVAIVETDRGAYVVAIMAEGDWNWDLVQRAARAVHEELTRR
ncbi:MAG: hypothetical protein KatS3mg064_0431 [Tepidiforma sp.]|nr:serine hydrolase [Tepidiforma sp.]GIW17274.1 MAG: hypothetical protein KatS3mg064_0431 [Tepidiforma sp.]